MIHKLIMSRNSSLKEQLSLIINFYGAKKTERRIVNDYFLK